MEFSGSGVIWKYIVILNVKHLRSGVVALKIRFILDRLNFNGEGVF